MVIDLDAVGRRYSAALDARPSKGVQIGDKAWTALTDSVADIPALTDALRQVSNAHRDGIREAVDAVQAVYDLQCPPQGRNVYMEGAWAAHNWWSKVLGGVLRELRERAEPGCVRGGTNSRGDR